MLVRSTRSAAALAVLLGLLAATLVLRSSASAQDPGPRTLTFTELERGATFTHIRNTKGAKRQSNLQGDILALPGGGFVWGLPLAVAAIVLGVHARQRTETGRRKALAAILGMRARHQPGAAARRRPAPTPGDDVLVRSRRRQADWRRNINARRKEVRMQRPFFITALAVLTCALVLPAVAAAGPVSGPPSFHDRTVEDFVDDDFCGTGADVSGHFEGHATVWETEDAVKVLFNAKTWWTYNGITLVEQFAGRTVDIAAPPQSGAAETREVIETGLRARLKLANGKVLTTDHGLLHFLVNFDAEGEFLGIEVLRDRGGHPAFRSDVWCEAATAAFGIPFPA